MLCTNPPTFKNEILTFRFLLFLQEFVVRNDMGCGSTIGAILASGVGIRTVDCGIAQLSMHRYVNYCHSLATLSHVSKSKYVRLSFWFLELVTCETV